MKQPDVTKAWIEAGQSAGYPYNDDTNGPTRDGFGPVDLTVGGGRRSSTAAAYLAPARRRPNLTVVTEAHATRVVIEGGKAVAVEYARDGDRHTVRAAEHRMRRIMLGYFRFQNHAIGNVRWVRYNQVNPPVVLGQQAWCSDVCADEFDRGALGVAACILERRIGVVDADDPGGGEVLSQRHR